MRSTTIMMSAALVAGVAGAVLLSAPPASARVFVGVGVGFPIYGYPPPIYYPPPPVYYAPPPPVVYAPPPAYYTAPPPAYAAPPPAYAEPPPSASAAPPAAATGNCREYQSQTTIGGRPQTTVGTACLQPDGTWRIMN